MFERLELFADAFDQVLSVDCFDDGLGIHNMRDVRRRFNDCVHHTDEIFFVFICDRSSSGAFEDRFDAFG